MLRKIMLALALAALVTPEIGRAAEDKSCQTSRHLLGLAYVARYSHKEMYGTADLIRALERKVSSCLDPALS